MKHQMYAIYDKVSHTYAQPYCAINDATATRNTADLLRRDEGLNLHSGDFSLEKIGEYDDQTGVITPETKPILIVRLSSLKTPEGDSNANAK